MHTIREAKPNTTALVMILLCVFGVGVCFGQSADANERLHTKVTYSCENLPIEVALKELADQAGVYIVKSPVVTGEVTIEVVDVPLDELLANVLGAYNYTYIATKNMIRVVPLSESVVMRETLITQIYKITYADAREVAIALGEFISLNGKVSFNKGTSHIIVTDTEDKIKAIDKFIEEIDKATPQVVVEVRIYDITSEEAFEIEAEWNAESNEHTVTTDRKEVTSTRTGAEGVYPSTVTTYDADLGYDETVTTNYEISGHNDDDDYSDTGLFYDEDFTQTVTTEHPTEISTKTVTTSYPTDTYNVNNDTTTKSYTKKRRKPKIGASFNKKDGGTIRISLLDNAIDLDFALSMLHSTVEAKLLASPRVMVLDNETASFETVREVPYTERTTDGGSTLTSTKFKPVGVQLDVTPHVARDGMVRLKVKPEFGVVVDIDENGAPTIETRRTETTTLIRDGQTIVLAGLRKKEVRKGIDKMPLLGDLPLLGGLFRAESEEEVTSELVVFITTRIVTEPELTTAEKKQYGATNFGKPKLIGNTLLEGERRRSKTANKKYKPHDYKPKTAASKRYAPRDYKPKTEVVAYEATATITAPEIEANCFGCGDENTITETSVEAQIEIVEAEEAEPVKTLEPIEAEPISSTDFIKQWMARTKK